MQTGLIPAIFRYNSVISAPLFCLIALFLIAKIPQFSFSDRTVSQSIHFLNSTQKIIFKMNFILKSLLDLGFAWYVIAVFHIPLTSPVAWILIISTASFGLLAYFTEDTYKTIHRVIIYSVIALSTISQLAIAQLTGDDAFIQVTSILACIQIVFAFGFLIAGKTNAIVQLICAICAYTWLVVFALQY